MHETRTVKHFEVNSSKEADHPESQDTQGAEQVKNPGGFEHRITSDSSEGNTQPILEERKGLEYENVNVQEISSETLMSQHPERHKYRHEFNTSKKSTLENQPPYTKNEVGDSLIQRIENVEDKNGTRVRIEWNKDAQQRLHKEGAHGMTYNPFNGLLEPENRGADKICVCLGPDATNAVVYKEYLHVKEAEKRDWGPPKNRLEVLKEEFKVEYEVLNKARQLDMFDDEFDELAEGRRKTYINPLVKHYKGEKNVPDQLKKYLHDPPKPKNLPLRS